MFLLKLLNDANGAFVHREPESDPENKQTAHKQFLFSSLFKFERFK